MKPIELNKIQKEHLLEMCRKLWPEYPSVEFWNFDSYDDFCGLGGDERIDDCLCFYSKKLPMTNGNPPAIDWERVQENNKIITFHWFEFVFTHLINNLYYNIDYHDSSEYNCNLHVELTLNMLNYNIHPVDYLYEQFLKIKK